MVSGNIYLFISLTLPPNAHLSHFFLFNFIFPLVISDSVNKAALGKSIWYREAVSSLKVCSPTVPVIYPRISLHTVTCCVTHTNELQHCKWKCQMNFFFFFSLYQQFQTTRSVKCLVNFHISECKFLKLK